MHSIHPHDIKVLVALFAVAILTIAFLSSDKYAKKNPTDKGVKVLSKVIGSVWVGFCVNLLWVLFH